MRPSMRATSEGSSARIAVGSRHADGVPRARFGLVQDGAESGRVDATIDARNVGGLEHPGADSERLLEGQCLLELRPHRGRHADEDATLRVAGMAPDGFAEA